MARKMKVEVAPSPLIKVKPKPVVKVEPKPVINPTDVLYAFVSWLEGATNRIYKLGGAEPSLDMEAAMTKFCEANNLPPLSDGFEKKFVKPEHTF